MAATIRKIYFFDGLMQSTSSASESLDKLATDINGALKTGDANIRDKFKYAFYHILPDSKYDVNQFGQNEAEDLAAIKTFKRAQLLNELVKEVEIDWSSTIQVMCSHSPEYFKKFFEERNLDVHIIRGIANTTLLMHAAIIGNKNLMEFLLSKGADVNETNDKKETALRYAAFGNLDCFQLLLEHKADLRLQDERGGTPLMLAAYMGRSEIVQCALEHSSNPNVQNNDGNTALSSITNPHNCNPDSEKLKIVQMLLKYRANPDLPNNFGCTPFQEALTHCNKDIISLIQEEVQRRSDYRNLLALLQKEVQQ